MDETQRVEGLTLFKDLAWAALIKLATQKLLATLPAFLVAGPVGWIVGAVVGMVGNAVYDALAEMVSLNLIPFKNEAFQREYDSSSFKLRLIARDKGIGSPEFKKARQENVTKLSQLIHFGATA